MSAGDPIKPRTMLAIADAWLKLDGPSKLRIREISPQLAGNVERLARAVRAGAVEIDTDEYLHNLEAERRHTYVEHSLSRSHRTPEPE